MSSWEGWPKQQRKVLRLLEWNFFYQKKNCPVNQKKIQQFVSFRSRLFPRWISAKLHHKSPFLPLAKNAASAAGGTKSQAGDEIGVTGSRWGQLHLGTSSGLRWKVSRERDGGKSHEGDRGGVRSASQLPSRLTYNSLLQNERNNESGTMSARRILEVWNGVAGDDTNYIPGRVC